MPLEDKALSVGAWLLYESVREENVVLPRKHH